MDLTRIEIEIPHETATSIFNSAQNWDSHLETDIPSEKATPTRTDAQNGLSTPRSALERHSAPTWSGAQNDESTPTSALEFRIEQLLQKWMEHFDRRFEELREGHSTAYSTACLQELIDHQRDSISGPNNGKKANFLESADPANFGRATDGGLVSRQGTKEQRPSGNSEKSREQREGRRDTAAPNLDMSVALQGRQSMQRKMEELHECLVTKKSMQHRGLGAIAHHPWFENFISFAIILNGIFIGVQVDVAARSDHGDHIVFSVAETTFFVVFFFEVLLRIIVFKIEWVKSAWNVFDAALVMVQLVEFLVKWVSGGTGSGGSGRVLRVFRIVRIVRVVRLLRFFVQLRVMVKMIMFSLESLFWLMILLLVMMYVVSIIFTQGVTNYISEEGVALREDGQFLKIHFRDIATTTLTLFKAITNGISWGLLSDSLFEAHYMLGWIFLFFVFFVFFSVLNVVTGVFVDGAIQHGGQERELLVAAERKSLEGICVKLMELLVDIDSDGSGTITLEELFHCARDPQFSSYFAALQIYTPETAELFRYLDVNNDGEIDVQEFIDGCLRIRGGARNIDLHMLMSAMDAEQKKRLRKLESTLKTCQYELGVSNDNIQRVKADIGKIPVVMCGPRPSRSFSPTLRDHSKLVAPTLHDEATGRCKRLSL